MRTDRNLLNRAFSLRRPRASEVQAEHRSRVGGSAHLGPMHKILSLTKRLPHSIGLACLAAVATVAVVPSAGLAGHGGGHKAAMDTQPQVVSFAEPATPSPTAPTGPTASIPPVGSAGVPVVVPAQSVETVETPVAPRIMLVGDSITHGPAGAYTWRYFLYQHLVESYGPDDFFVGPSQEPNDGTADDYAVPGGWDKDHAARSGRMLDCYLDGLIKDEPCTDPGRAAEDLAAHDPELVVVMLGTNDVLLNWGQSTPAEYLAHAEQLVAMGRENNPTVSFLLLGVIPVDPALVPVAAAEAAEINAGLEALAAQLDAPSARVAYAPGGTGFDPVAHTADGVHPNTAGDQVIAANAAVGLAENFDIGV